MNKSAGMVLGLLLLPSLSLASGYGVFTQGASGLGQANAVVAHPTGPSSLYFNPALLNDVPGRQVEVGTTAVYGKREIDLDNGGTEENKHEWQTPSTLYYTHNSGERIAAGIGVFFPFGLANEWDNDYEGKYIGTKGEMFSMNINPAVSFKVNDRLSLAAGIDFVYLDADLRAMINQEKLGVLVNFPDGFGPLPPIEQKFTGDGWGHGFNLGALYKITDRISIGAAYRSQVDVDLEGSLDFSGAVLPGFVNGDAESDIKLPAQFVVGVATKIADNLIVEVGARWEDWDTNDILRVDLEQAYPLSPTGDHFFSVDRNWRSTWTYNVGANYRLNESVALNCGYLYGENPEPDSTFEPIIGDSDAHLFTVGTDLTYGQWTVSAAFGYEYHESRDKNNLVRDEVGSTVESWLAQAPISVGTANGEYDTEIYLLGLSVGYKF